MNDAALVGWGMREDQADSEGVMALTFGRPHLVDGPVRVNFKNPCVVDSTGVTLHRWPWRSIQVPLEQVDRFDVVEEERATSSEHPEVAWDPVERLVLLTRDGETLGVSRMSLRRVPPARYVAIQLNNHLVRLNRRRQQPPDHTAR